MAMKADMPYITVRVMVNHKYVKYQAVKMWRTPEGSWAMLESGYGQYARKEDAEIIGRYWAEEQGLEFR